MYRPEAGDVAMDRTDRPDPSGVQQIGESLAVGYQHWATDLRLGMGRAGV
jgi:hypothetical protein